MPLTLAVRLVRPNATLPRYATAGAAGLDLSAAIDAPLVLEANAQVAVPTGVAIALPAGHEGQVRPRSGLARKFGITMVNTPGTIDEDYRGEISVLLWNTRTTPFTIAPGDRIAQLVIAPVSYVSPLEVPSLDETARGSGGFGSTGV